MHSGSGSNKAKSYGSCCSGSGSTTQHKPLILIIKFCNNSSKTDCLFMAQKINGNYVEPQPQEPDFEILLLLTSVTDPEPDPDPNVFWPSGSGSTSQRYGSEDPDPPQYVMDPEHCFQP